MLQDGLLWTETGDAKSTKKASFSEIKTQMANNVGSSGKILLKLVMESESISFAFESVEERAIIITAIKELKSTLSAEEIATRQALLQINPEWKQLHKDLVVNGNIVKEEEFWFQRQESLIQQQFVSNQKKGTSSILLADLKPSLEQEDMKFTLNADIIHSIFTQYPGVHKAYLDHVPDKLSEKEFWTKYFLSKYFHRNRMVTAKASLEEDIFADYMASVENDFNLHPVNIIYEAQNKLLDLTSTLEDHGETGNGPDSTMKAGSVRESLPLIRKFNRHSQLILNSCLEPQKKKSRSSFYKDVQQETTLQDLELSTKVVEVPFAIQDASKYFKMGTSKEEERPSIAIKLNLDSISFTSLATKRFVMKSNCMRNTNIQIDGIVSAECKSIQSSGNELLRHFWASLKDSDRLERISKALQKIGERAETYEGSLTDIRQREACTQSLLGLRLSLVSASEKYSQYLNQL